MDLLAIDHILRRNYKAIVSTDKPTLLQTIRTFVQETKSLDDVPLDQCKRALKVASHFIEEGSLDDLLEELFTLNVLGADKSLFVRTIQHREEYGVFQSHFHSHAGDA